ncbi:APC family permease [Mycobacterium aquaticum]|uniref:Amino acid permease n=1 Tax=Mycobacterium aquaticum TaxID=1927124 RepID=A0A1X0AI92_9MYCO|nr:APC family permease [Mycobacterium aquaticum]ORA29777.1 amino acid permease [Mycobacterium aquaticum]
MTPTEQSIAPVDVTLQRRSLGVPDVVFFVVAASAPLTVVAGGVPTSFAVTKVLGIPLVYVLVAATLLIFAVGYAAMSRHVANAGAFYSYVAKGLGRTWGVAAALIALVAYNAMQVGIYGLFGFAAAGALHQFLGVSVAWWVPVLVTVVVVGILGVLQVDLNARVLGFFLIAESVVVLVFDIAGIAKPAEGISFHSLVPSSLTGGALGAAFCFVVASFVGFESAAIYGEECKDPRRTVARSTYVAVTLIGVFYAFSAWAMTVAVGPSSVIDTSVELGPGLLFEFSARNVGGWFSDVATVLFVTSLFAALLSFHNAVARYFFSLGREGVLPRRLAMVNPRTGAPVAGSIAQTTLAAVLVVVFAIAGKDPVLALFTWLTNVGALGVILLMALTSVSVVVYLLRHRSVTESNLAHELAGVVASVALFAMFILAVANFDALVGTTPDDALNWVLPGIVVAAGLIGIGYGEWLRRRQPAVHAAIGSGGPAEA